MARWPVLAYGALVAVGAANREMTAVLLVLSWLALCPRSWRAGVVFAAVAVAVQLVIRSTVGDAPNHYGMGDVWALNTEPRWLFSAGIYMGLLLPLLVAAMPHWHSADVALRRHVLIVAVGYLPFWAALALWRETRLLMPLIVLLLPMVTEERHVES